MPIDLDSLPKCPEYTDEQVCTMTAYELLSAPALLFHDNDNKTVRGENAAGRELVRRLEFYEDSVSGVYDT